MQHPADDFATLFDFLPIGAYRSSPEGLQLRANPALVQLNGYASEAEQLAGVRDIATEWYVDPHRRAEFARALERDGFVRSFESEIYRHRSRERIWISENAHVVRGPGGRVLYYEGTVEDISERVASQAALARSAAQLREITRELHGVLFKIDFAPDGSRRIVFVSDGVEALFGIDAATALALPDGLRRYIHPDDRDHVAAEIAAAEAAKRPLIQEFRIVAADGTFKWVQMSSADLPALTGERAARCGVILDIADRKEADALRRERDVAEAADRAKTLLLSRLSHELRTPLNGILGCAQVLSGSRTLGADDRVWVQQVLDSGRHLLALVDDVLELSSASAGTLRLAWEEVDPLVIAARSGAMLQAQAAACGLRFEFVPPSCAALRVQADARRLTQIVGHLLSHAIAQHRRGGCVTVWTEARTDRVHLVLADNGVGLDAASLERRVDPLDPFDRFDPFETSVGRRNGLGLGLSRRLVEAMGGALSVDSPPGCGVTFTVALPAARAAAAAAAADAALTAGTGDVPAILG